MVVFFLVFYSPNLMLARLPSGDVQATELVTASAVPKTTQILFGPTRFPHVSWPDLNLLPAHIDERVGHLLGHTLYCGGDGIDSDALEWINVLETRNAFYELSSMPEVTVAIIDSGIDPDVWKYIETNGGDIVYYVRYKAYDDNTYEAAVYWDSDVYDGCGHGSATASILWQVAPKAKLLIIDVTDSFAVSQNEVEKGLQWIINNHCVYDVDIVSMSFGFSSETMISNTHNEIQTLYTSYGVSFFASSGNDDLKQDKYPASWSEVISVGAIFDDWDGYLTNGASFNPNYRGYRVANAKSDDYRESGWGSTYSNNIDFVAPSFDVEVLDYNEEGLQDEIGDIVGGVWDGTSFSCPFGAGVAALVIDAYYDHHQAEPSVSQVYGFLKLEAETRVYRVDYPVIELSLQYTPHPTAGGKTFLMLLCGVNGLAGVVSMLTTQSGKQHSSGTPASRRKGIGCVNSSEANPNKKKDNEGRRRSDCEEERAMSEGSLKTLRYIKVLSLLAASSGLLALSLVFAPWATRMIVSSPTYPWLAGVTLNWSGWDFATGTWHFLGYTYSIGAVLQVWAVILPAILVAVSAIIALSSPRYARRVILVEVISGFVMLAGILLSYLADLPSQTGIAILGVGVETSMIGIGLYAELVLGAVITALSCTALLVVSNEAGRTL